MYKELWLPVKGYEGIYEINIFGKVRSLDKTITPANGKASYLLKGRLMKPTISGCRYYIIGLRKNKKVKLFLLHRLIAENLIPNPDNKNTVNHKNLNKLDNTISNLEWVSLKENSKHAFENGVMSGAFKDGENGAKVKCQSSGKIFETIKEASEYIGISKKRLAHMVSGRCKNLTSIVKI